MKFSSAKSDHTSLMEKFGLVMEKVGGVVGGPCGLGAAPVRHE